VVLCTGKIYYDVAGRQKEINAAVSASVRVERR
jgi:2-oxoglutarate dehydrogenase complex dehydrogenase (E1) component-like enzyme